MATKQVRSSLEGSYERLCYDSGIASFLVPLGGTGAVAASCPSSGSIARSA